MPNRPVEPAAKVTQMLLSHYTNRAGLEGITSTGTLWATNFLMLNDSAEYFHAWEQIQSEAFDYTLQRLPKDLLDSNAQKEMALAATLREMREELLASDGYGQLFLTSLASTSSADQEENGILTLWDRYTDLKGYCLQFERAAIERMIRLDASTHNYAWISLSKVEYGALKETAEFRQLVEQLSSDCHTRCYRRRRAARVREFLGWRHLSSAPADLISSAALQFEGRLVVVPTLSPSHLGWRDSSAA
jgi:hypothetical protein